MDSAAGAAAAGFCGNPGNCDQKPNTTKLQLEIPQPSSSPSNRKGKRKRRLASRNNSSVVLRSAHSANVNVNASPISPPIGTTSTTTFSPVDFQIGDRIIIQKPGMSHPTPATIERFEVRIFLHLREEGTNARIKAKPQHCYPYDPAFLTTAGAEDTDESEVKPRKSKRIHETQSLPAFAHPALVAQALEERPDQQDHQSQPSPADSGVVDVDGSSGSSGTSGNGGGGTVAVAVPVPKRKRKKGRRKSVNMPRKKRGLSTHRKSKSRGVAVAVPREPSPEPTPPAPMPVAREPSPEPAPPVPMPVAQKPRSKKSKNKKTPVLPSALARIPPCTIPIQKLSPSDSTTGNIGPVSAPERPSASSATLTMVSPPTTNQSLKFAKCKSMSPGPVSMPPRVTAIRYPTRQSLVSGFGLPTSILEDVPLPPRRSTPGPRPSPTVTEPPDQRLETLPPKIPKRGRGRPPLKLKSPEPVEPSTSAQAPVRLLKICISGLKAEGSAEMQTDEEIPAPAPGINRSRSRTRAGGKRKKKSRSALFTKRKRSQSQSKKENKNNQVLENVQNDEEEIQALVPVPVPITITKPKRKPTRGRGRKRRGRKPKIKKPAPVSEAAAPTPAAEEDEESQSIFEDSEPDQESQSFFEDSELDEEREPSEISEDSELDEDERAPILIPENLPEAGNRDDGNEVCYDCPLPDTIDTYTFPNGSGTVTLNKGDRISIRLSRKGAQNQKSKESQRGVAVVAEETEAPVPAGADSGADDDSDPESEIKIIGESFSINSPRAQVPNTTGSRMVFPPDIDVEEVDDREPVQVSHPHAPVPVIDLESEPDRSDFVGYEIRRCIARLPRQSAPHAPTRPIIFKSEQYEIPGTDCLAQDQVSQRFVPSRRFVPVIDLTQVPRASTTNTSKCFYPLQARWNKYETPNLPYFYDKDREFIIPKFIRSPTNSKSYKLGVFLGGGAFGYCFQAKKTSSKDPPETLVCKVQYCGSRLKPDDINTQEHEIEIHRPLIHPNIVRLVDNFIHESKVRCMLMESCVLGSIADAFRNRTRIPPKHVKYFIKQLFNGLAYLHNDAVPRIVHCDIKPENLLVTETMILKICDFGLSIRLGKCKGQMLRELGSPNYISPELIDGLDGGRMDFGKVDVWSAAITLVTFMNGSEPFHGNGMDDTFKKIKTLNWDVLGGRKQVARRDSSAIQFLNKIFVPIDNRITSQEALGLPYLNENIPEELPIYGPFLRNIIFGTVKISDKMLKRKLTEMESAYKKLVDLAGSGDSDEAKITNLENSTLYYFYPAQPIPIPPKAFGYVLRNGAKGKFNSDSSMVFQEQEFWSDESPPGIYIETKYGFKSSSEMTFNMDAVPLPVQHYFDALQTQVPAHSHAHGAPELRDLNDFHMILSPRVRWYSNSSKPQQQLVFSDGAVQIESGSTGTGEVWVGTPEVIGIWDKSSGTWTQVWDINKLKNMSLGLSPELGEMISKLLDPIRSAIGALDENIKLYNKESKLF